LKDLGQPQAAESAYRDAQVLWRKLLENFHTEDHRFHLAVNYDALGILLREAGRTAESLAAFQDAQAIWLELVADFNQEDRRMHLGQTDDAISNLLMAFSRFDEAAETERQALVVWKKLAVDFNNNSYRERATLASEQLAHLLHEQGQDAEAETLERELAEAPSSQTLNQLAWRLATAPDAKLRSGSNAVSYAERAVAQTNRKHVSYLDTLAAAYAETGQFAKAISVQKEALALSQNAQEKQDLASKLRLYENNSPYRDHVSLAELTRTWLAEGKFADAEPLARECLTLREIEIPDDWRTFNARSMVGDALLGQKKYAEAEPLLLAAYEGMKQREDKIPAAGKLRVKETLQRLVQLYDATGPTDRAGEWKRKLAEFDQAESETKNIVPKP
jgi:tetratricopeptide (TPR) repeat protein